MYKIVTYPNEVLDKKSEKINFPLKKADKELAQNMLKQVNDDDGAAGLAAPQVGFSKQICVVSDEKGKSFLMINPEITFSSQLEIPIIEGCLSFPEEFYEINRPKNIKVEYFDIDGKKRKAAIGGWLARVIQHEVDHLNGTVFINRGGRKVTKEEIEERNKEVVD